jgi:hypothetical protein
MDLRNFDLNKAKQDIPQLSRRSRELTDLIKESDEHRPGLEKVLSSESGVSDPRNRQPSDEPFKVDRLAAFERRMEEYERLRTERMNELARVTEQLADYISTAKALAANRQKAGDDISREGARLGVDEAKGDFKGGSRAMQQDSQEANRLYDIGRAAIQYSTQVQSAPSQLTGSAYTGLPHALYGGSTASVADAENRAMPYQDLLDNYLHYYAETDDEISQPSRLPLLGRGSDPEPKTLFEKIMAGMTKAPPSRGSEYGINLPSFYERIRSHGNSSEYQA